MFKDFKTYNSNVFRDVIIFEPDFFEDHRGFIYSSYLENIFLEKINDKFKFAHNKFAHNHKGVLRGIHGDFESWKMVSCVYGHVYQVVVDNRKESATYLQHEVFNLYHKKPKQIIIPPGFGNAFLVLSDYAVYNYQLAYTGEYNDFDKQFTLKWNDENLNIDWPIKEPILSNRDK